MVSTTGQQEHNENAEQLGGTNFDASKKACVSAFDVACDADAYEAARMSFHKAEDLTVAEQGRMVREGNLDPSQVTSNKAFAAVAQKRGDDVRKENKAKASADALFYAMLQQLRDDVARLDNAIADIEDELVSRYGENWAADAATDILGEIPDRLPNETDEEYEERLVDLYKDEMIDPETGELKDKWKDHPDERMRLIADRVKLDHDRDQAKQKEHDYTHGTPEQKREIEQEAKAADNLQETYELADNLSDEASQKSLDDASDVARDSVEITDSIQGGISNRFG